MNGKNLLKLASFSILLALSACGSQVDGGGSGGSGGAAGSGGNGGNGGVLDIRCNDFPPAFPSFDKTCAADADCVIKLHMVDCCGSRAAIGVAATASSAFDAAEATCESQYPGCGCASGPTTTEDGKVSLDDTKIGVACSSGACSTFFP